MGAAHHREPRVEKSSIAYSPCESARAFVYLKYNEVRGMNFLAKIEEDAVRDGYAPSDGSPFVKGAKQILGFDKPEAGVEQGTGQIRTFNSLGFRDKKKNHKPDGWYFPNDLGKVAIVLETKNSEENLQLKKWKDEILDNVDIVMQKYSKVIGILYNGIDIRVFKNHDEVTSDISKKLESKRYYIRQWTDTELDIESIRAVTMRINNNLHFKFGMQDLQDRMIFTACALVAQRYNPQNGLQTLKGKDYSTFHNWIFSALSKALEDDKKQNDKLNVLLEEYSAVNMSITENQDAINSFIDDVCRIADLVNSDRWNGEDVMGIFFNEFNRYRKKSDAGQVFTPDHVTSFMYRLLGVTMDDYVLDATCGSGAFLAKAMSNMIREAGGMSTEKAAEIKKSHLFGIEMYRKVFALACANMMIHKDGKTNLAQMDATTEEASKWIKSKPITKVLMNPPYERKYHCMKIVQNVLDSVKPGTKCAFIMPDKKLEKDNGKKLLKHHQLSLIIKMPENLFFGVGVTTSIYVFTAGTPQDDKKVLGYYIEDDGLETVKNQGRQDIRHRWADELEDYWIGAITDPTSEYFCDTLHKTRQIIDPEVHLSYQMPKKPFEVSEEDFMKTMMDYEMFKRGIDSNDFHNKLLEKCLYSNKIEVKTSDAD